MRKLHLRTARACVVLTALAMMPFAFGQQPAPPTNGGGAAPGAQPGMGRAGRGPTVTSPEVLPDRRIAFRILAPNAQAVRVTGGDIPALAGGRGGAPGPHPRLRLRLAGR